MRFTDYRRHMERAAASWFRSRGLSVRARTPYVLNERGDWKDNLILPDLAPLIEGQRAGFPLHKWVHHGLSSQAMLFNLLLPLIDRDAVEDLRMAFPGIPWPQDATLRLEVEDRTVFAENRGQPTSLDASIEGGGAPLFIEAKLVEQEFGGCSQVAGGECDGRNPWADHALCPLHRLGRLYWSRLEDQGFELGEGPFCHLATNYQFFREVAFALHRGGHLILLVHDDNPAFYAEEGRRGLWPLLAEGVPEVHRDRLHRVGLRQVVDALRATGGHEDWLPDFEHRYGLKPQATSQASLEDLPPALQAEVQRVWALLDGGRARGVKGGPLQQRISRLLRDEGLSRQDREPILAHGRRLYGR